MKTIAVPIGTSIAVPLSCPTQVTASLLVTHESGRNTFVYSTESKDNCIYTGESIVIWTGFTRMDTLIHKWLSEGDDVLTLVRLLNTRPSGEADSLRHVAITVLTIATRSYSTVFYSNGKWKVTPVTDVHPDTKAEMIVLTSIESDTHALLNHIVTNLMQEHKDPRSVLRDTLSVLTGIPTDDINIRDITKGGSNDHNSSGA